MTDAWARHSLANSYHISFPQAKSNQRISHTDQNGSDHREIERPAASRAPPAKVKTSKLLLALQEEERACGARQESRSRCRRRCPRKSLRRATPGEISYNCSSCATSPRPQTSVGWHEQSRQGGGALDYPQPTAAVVSAREACAHWIEFPHTPKA